MRLGAYLFGVPRRPGVDQYPGTSRLPGEVGVYHPQGEPRHIRCHFDACFGLPERRIVRGSFEAHADDVPLAPNPRHILWTWPLVG